VEIVPVSKDSVICLPHKLANQLGGISPLCLVQRVTNCVHLIDPTTTQSKSSNLADVSESDNIKKVALTRVIFCEDTYSNKIPGPSIQ
jgi:NMD protein affecting ribosome stability and mRNA decay